MKELERIAVFARPTKKFATWVNKLPNSDGDIGLDVLRQEASAYLLYCEYPEDTADTLKAEYSLVFESVLNEYSSNKNEWPKDRSFAMFNKYFDVDVAIGVVDFNEEDIDEHDRLVMERDDDDGPLDNFEEESEGNFPDEDEPWM